MLPTLLVTPNSLAPEGPVTMSVARKTMEGPEGGKQQDEVDHQPQKPRGPQQQQQQQQQLVGDPDLSWLTISNGSRRNNNRLYGRDRELAQLREAFHRRLGTGAVVLKTNPTTASKCASNLAVSSGPSNPDPPAFELVLVSGKSGEGKSCLAQVALQDLVTEHGGYYVVGKFDQLQVPEPYAPYVAALTELVVRWEATLDKASLQTIGQRLSTKLGTDNCAVLLALIPALARILVMATNLNNNNTIGTSSSSSHGPPQQQQQQRQEQSQEPHINPLSSSSSITPVRLATATATTAMGREAQQDRLKVALRRFLNAVCSSKQPLVLVMDDLQWADAGSLALLDAISSEDSIEGLLVVAICRSDEVPVHHEFAGLLRRLEDQKGTQITHIQVGNLPLEATNDLISDILQQPPNLCWALTDIIHDKTNGNVFCLYQFVRALYEEGVLVAERTATNNNQHQWLWDDDKWEQSFLRVELDIVKLVSSQIKGLSAPCQRLLGTASFMGAQFELDILRAFSWDEHSLQTALSEAMDEGFIKQRPHHPGKYSFSHDQIQLGAYALVPDDEQASFHLSIGKTLYQHLSPKELKAKIFLVVNQMIRGVSLLEAESDKNGLASLCLQAGKKSTQSSDFVAAIFYFETGIGLLAKRSWRDEYQLCLDLYSSLVEATCCTADFERMDDSINEVLDNARSHSDKVRAYTTQVHSLGARLYLREALDVGLYALDKLGEKIPAKPGLIQTIAGLIGVKRKLSKKSDDDILNLPDMDPGCHNQMAAMAILSMMTTFTFVEQPELFPALCFAMVQISLKHGLCAVSSHAFCSFAVVLCAMDDYDGAYRCSMLALKILDRYHHTRAEWLPRVFGTVHGLIIPWKRPIHRSITPLLEAHSVGKASGDLEFSCLAGFFLSANFYVSGKPIGDAEKKLEGYVEMMISQKQETWLSVADLLLQVLKNLAGKADNPLMIQCENTATYTSKASYQAYTCSIMIYQMVLAYHFDDLPLALDCAKKSRIGDRVLKPVPVMWVQYFYDGMSSLQAARMTKSAGKRRKHMAWGRKLIQRFEKLAALCPENMLHFLYLLKAEMMDLKKGNNKRESAIYYYTKSAEHAEKEGCMYVHALALECRGKAHCRWYEKAQGDIFLQRSIEVYRQWGAFAIVLFKETEYSQHL